MKWQLSKFQTYLIFALALTLFLIPMSVSADPGGHRHGSDNWHLFGEITAAPASGDLIGAWAIDGESFMTDEDTVFDQSFADLAVGAYAHAVGYYDDAEQRFAYRLETLPDDAQDRVCQTEDCWHAFGELTEFPEGLIGSWTVDDMTFVANEDTVFIDHGETFAAGDRVHAVGVYDDEGEAIALRVMLVGAGGYGDGACDGAGGGHHGGGHGGDDGNHGGGHGHGGGTGGGRGR